MHMTDLKNTLFLTHLQKLKPLNPHLKCCFGDYHYIKFQYTFFVRDTAFHIQCFFYVFFNCPYTNAACSYCKNLYTKLLRPKDKSDTTHLLSHHPRCVSLPLVLDINTLKNHHC